MKINQTLHGYADGHRQLASSIALKQRDIATLLVLSDSSGTSGHSTQSGYLTGYPLPETKVFAFARTWPATEMPRPGCVWTHTLLIDFADLAEIADLSSLLRLFRRPVLGESHTLYQTPILFSDDFARPKSPADYLNSEFVRKILSALYASPRVGIAGVPPPSANVEQVVVALWSQQWPRLRRSFRFCTSVAIDRSTDSAVFDLQLFEPASRGARQLSPSIVDMSDLPPASGAWLETAASDLAHPDAQGLRSFLRRTGGELESGREAFRMLCELYQLIERTEYDPSAIDVALSLLGGKDFPPTAKTVRELIVSAAVEHVDSIPNKSLGLLLDVIQDDQVGWVLKARPSGLLVQEVWKRMPTRLPELIGNGLIDTYELRSITSNLSDGDLLHGLSAEPRLLPIAISARPEILERSDFWSLDTLPPDQMLSSLSVSGESLRRVVAAMIKAGRQDVLGHLLARADAREGLVLLSQIHLIADVNPNELRRWIRRAAQDHNAVAAILMDWRDSTPDFLVTLAQSMDPDDVPNEYGTDPWWIAVSATKNSISTSTAKRNIYLKTFLLSRALGNRTHNSGELAHYAFADVHRAASKSEIPDDAWRVLEPKLPWSFDWFHWDRCPRIRDAVSDLFVDRQLSISLFVNLSNDDELFRLLIDTTARTWRGREYLAKVHSWLIDHERPRNIARTNIIERYLRSY